MLPPIGPPVFLVSRVLPPNLVESAIPSKHLVAACSGLVLNGVMLGPMNETLTVDAMLVVAPSDPIQEGEIGGKVKTGAIAVVSI